MERRQNENASIERDADSRHREVLLMQLGLPAGRGVTSSLEKVGVDDSALALLEDGAETFRIAVMRLGFLVVHRPDEKYAAKEAARGMAKPFVRHRRILRRCVRYLIHATTLTCRWYEHRWPGRIDTDRLGCPLTRRSTSGLTAQFSQHLWLTSRITQVPVSLSSGEAET